MKLSSTRMTLSRANVRFFSAELTAEEKKEQEALKKIEIFKKYKQKSCKLLSFVKTFSMPNSFRFLWSRTLTAEYLTLMWPSMSLFLLSEKIHLLPNISESSKNTLMNANVKTGWFDWLISFDFPMCYYIYEYFCDWIHFIEKGMIYHSVCHYHKCDRPPMILYWMCERKKLSHIFIW